MTLLGRNYKAALKPSLPILQSLDGCVKCGPSLYPVITPSKHGVQMRSCGSKGGGIHSMSRMKAHRVMQCTQSPAKVLTVPRFIREIIAVPGQPMSVSAKAMGPSKVELAWEPPLLAHNILAYRVRYNATQAGDAPTSVEVSSPREVSPIPSSPPPFLLPVPFAAEADDPRPASGHGVRV